jgi:hypothetical protein
LTKSKTATKAAKQKVPKMAKGEVEQVRIRRDLGHDFALKQDEHGRTHLIAGSVDARRVYEVSNDGHISTGGIVRVRKVDPLKGILSLTDRQRGAGLRYREDFEFAAREGLKTGAYQERVDGGRMSATISARLLDNHAALHQRIGSRGKRGARHPGSTAAHGAGEAGYPLRHCFGTETEFTPDGRYGR